jgi:hypothetical protein
MFSVVFFFRNDLPISNCFVRGSNDTRSHRKDFVKNSASGCALYEIIVFRIVVTTKQLTRFNLENFTLFRNLIKGMIQSFQQLKYSLWISCTGPFGKSILQRI